jgi:hypothetical protein
MATPPDFTTGAILTAAQMNAVGLWLVKSQTIGAGVSSVTVTNAFSADYDNYEIVYQMGDASVLAAFFITFNNSTGSTYSYGGAYNLYGIASFPSETANNTSDGIRIGNVNGDFSSGVFQVISPFLTTPTHVMSQHADNTYFSVRGGRDSNVASHTDFTLVAPGATLTGGTIRVYGRRN